MSELISKDGAIEAVCKWCEHPYCKSKDDCGQRIAIATLPSVETTAQYDDFHEEIKKLTQDVEYYQDRCEALTRINDSQNETIRTYAQIVKILDAELNKLRGETI